MGPPGTGKSQSIAAVITDAVAAGNTVLFVAEKQAALDVVREKFDAAGHGDLLLDLRGNEASASAVRAEIDRTWRESATGKTQSDPEIDDDEAPGEDDPGCLLTAIANALHSPGPKGCDVSAWQALGVLVAAAGAGDPPPRPDLAALAEISSHEAERLEAALHRFANSVALFGPRHQHNWAGTTRRDLQPTDLMRLQSDLVPVVAALQEIDTVNTGLETFAARAGVDVALYRRLLAHRQDAPNITPRLAQAFWTLRDEPSFAKALEEVAVWQDGAEARMALFAPGAERQESATLRAPMSAATKALMPALSRSYREASETLAGLLECPLPAKARARYALLLELLAAQAHYRVIADNEAVIADALGDAWPGRTAIEPARWQSVLAWLQRLADHEPGLTAKAISAIFDETEAQLREVARFDAATRALARTLTPALERLGWALPASSDEVEKVAHRLVRLESDGDGYNDWLSLTASVAPLEAASLAEFARLVETDAISSEDAVREFRHALAEARWNAALRTRPVLAELRDLDRDALVERWHTLTQLRRNRASQVLRAVQAARMPAITDPDAGVNLLRRELGRRSGHMALRPLLRGAAATLQKMRPVFLASPYAVARFLAPGAMRFDLLVIDEASQMRPEHALGGIARADQVVVCGDDKQLPPTDFFERAFVKANSGGERVDLPPEPAQAVEMESILTLARAAGFDSFMLDTHYRSHAASLIATSNRLFYGGRLIMPPSPLDGQPGFGMRFERTNGVYYRGDGGEAPAGTNPLEADAIVAAISDHARHRPTSSLGVATFSVAQRDMVRDHLERARQSDPELDAWVEEREQIPQGSVFVKNLEDVQGDERDVIMIGIGYGPDHPGGRLASQNFGPVNRTGGERRLNTLFTRARDLCRVFCSFEPADINGEAALHAGPMVLRAFLEAANANHIAERAASEASIDLIRQDIARTVSGIGIPCNVALGPARYRADLAVPPENAPQGKGIAILLDTADGHGDSSEFELVLQREWTLRDRGWKIHRIWGTDWYYRRHREIERLKKTFLAAPDSARRS